MTSAFPVRRHDARERALELLYEAEAKGVRGTEVIDELPLAPDAYAVELVAGADVHREEAEALIVRFSRDWALDRMPLIDRIVLRLAIEELQHQADVPRGVVIDEAVELAKTFSTEESGAFVNGMLTSIADHVGR